MTFTEQVFNVYQQFYGQRSVLGNAPTLTIDPDAVGVREFPVEQAMDELAALVSYLIGRPDVRRMPLNDSLKIVEKAYADQPFWFDLLLNYFDVVLTREEEACMVEAEQLKEKAKGMVQDISQYESHKKNVIRHFADKIKQAKFHVDATRLIMNFFKMSDKDAKQAKEVLVTNPAYFSPIITHDVDGKVILTPSQAIEENKRLSWFLKRLL